MDTKPKEPLALLPNGCIPQVVIDALEFYAERHHFVIHDSTMWDTVSGEPANFYEDEANIATVEDGSVAKLALNTIRGTGLREETAQPAEKPTGKRTIPNPASRLLANAVVGGAGLFLPPDQGFPPEGKAAVLLYVPVGQVAGKSLPELQADLGLPWSAGNGEPVWLDQLA